jgi:hypothetical protein
LEHSSSASGDGEDGVGIVVDGLTVLVDEGDVEALRAEGITGVHVAEGNGGEFGGARAGFVGVAHGSGLNLKIGDEEDGAYTSDDVLTSGIFVVGEGVLLAFVESHISVEGVENTTSNLGLGVGEVVVADVPVDLSGGGVRSLGVDNTSLTASVSVLFVVHESEHVVVDNDSTLGGFLDYETGSTVGLGLRIIKFVVLEVKAGDEITVEVSEFEVETSRSSGERLDIVVGNFNIAQRFSERADLVTQTLSLVVNHTITVNFGENQNEIVGLRNIEQLVTLSGTLLLLELNEEENGDSVLRLDISMDSVVPRFIVVE